MPAVPGPVAWLDTADWDGVIPLLTPFDSTGSRLIGKITPGQGGDALATVSTDDGTLTWALDPATGKAIAINIHCPLAARGGWLATQKTVVGVDLHRTVAGSTKNEWFGAQTTLFQVYPGSDSALAMLGAGFLYGGRPVSSGKVVSSPLQIGPQGPPGLTASVLNTFPVRLGQDGQTVIPYPVQQPPVIPSTVHLIVNGEEYFAPDITVGPSAVTWANPAFPLEKTDRVVLRYT